MTILLNLVSDKLDTLFRAASEEENVNEVEVLLKTDEGVILKGDTGLLGVRIVFAVDRI